MDEEKLKILLNNLKEPVEEYKKLQADRKDTGFNIFYLISDYYYRETFHGDIIAALLSPEEKHNAKDLYLKLFLEMVNHELNKTGKGLYVPFYENAIVKREMGTNDGELRGRIDLFIEGKDKHCVVVENKLNNAPDTLLQLPKYYNDLKKKGYTVDAFVYMPLDSRKKPYDNDWKDEKNYINEHLVIIPAYSKEGVNLIKNWLEPAVEKSNSESLEEAKFVLKQYIKLLNNLTIDIMDNEEIIKNLVDENNIDTAFGIFSVWDDFAIKIKKDFIKKIKEKLEKLQYEVEVDDKGYNRIEITKSGYQSWKFIIERYSSNGIWYRGLEYTGESKINATKFCGWNKESESYPLGWEYYGEKKGEEYKGYWDNLETLRIMYNGEFAKEIVEEIDIAFEKIKNLQK